LKKHGILISMSGKGNCFDNLNRPGFAGGPNS